MLHFTDEEHIELADALGIAPVDLGQGGMFEQTPRFIRAAQELREAAKRWALREDQASELRAAVSAAREATVMPGGSTEARLERIEEKLAELLRRTEPA